MPSPLPPSGTLLSLPRLIAASLLRRGAIALDDAVSEAAFAVLRPVDGLRAAVSGARSRIIRGVTAAATAFHDRVLHVSGLVAGCDCTDDDADICTRDGEDRACPCGCHTAIGWVLP